MPRWNNADTKRLAQLIEEEGVIDTDNPAHKTLPFIDKVRSDHFQQFNKKNFCLNYRNKLRDYLLGAVELSGARRRNSEGKKSFQCINIILSLT